MKPYYQDDAVTIYHGDCREILPELPKVDLVLTDPPYGIGVNTAWLTELHLARSKPANMSDDLLQGDDGSLDLSFLFNYPQWLVWGFPYIYNKDATGWLVWDKQPGLDTRGITTPVECASTNLWRGWRMIRNMWGGYYREDGEQRYGHPTQKPIKLFHQIIADYSNNGLILDPFMGSGTTIRAAKDLGRKCIGIEIEEKYCEIAANRCSQMVMDLTLHSFVKEDKRWF